MSPCGDYSLACVTCRQRFEKWQRLFDEIGQEVVNLAFDHHAPTTWF